MFDIGWSEMMLIGIVALLVMGPKELPRLMQGIGLWLRKAQDITRDIRLSFDRMVRDSELQETKHMLDQAPSFAVDSLADSAYGASQGYANPSKGQLEKTSVRPTGGLESYSMGDHQSQESSAKVDSFSPLLSHADQETSLDVQNPSSPLNPTIPMQEQRRHKGG